MGTLTNSEVPDKNAALCGNQSGLHCLLRPNHFSEEEMNVQ